MAIFKDQLLDDAVQTRHIEDSAVTAAKLADGAVTPAKVGTTTASGITTGHLKYLSIDSATVKALLDGTPNSLAVQLPNGTQIIDFNIYTSTAAGGAGTVKVGTDANWNVASDDDAFVAAHDLNAAGSYMMSRPDAASQTTAASGVFSSDTANLTIQSSTDQSASSWAGGITILYI